MEFVSNIEDDSHRVLGAVKAEKTSAGRFREISPGWGVMRKNRGIFKR
jgi:hypothetical protein